MAMNKRSYYLRCAYNTEQKSKVEHMAGREAFISTPQSKRP